MGRFVVLRLDDWYRSIPLVQRGFFVVWRKRMDVAICLDRLGIVYCRFDNCEGQRAVKIGSALEGGDWAIISKIIEEFTEVTPVVYYI